MLTALLVMERKGPWIHITIYLILKVNNSFNILPQMLCLPLDFLQQKEAKPVTNHRQRIPLLAKNACFFLYKQGSICHKIFCK